MGTFRIEIQAVGAHGCQREVGDGETVEPDCGNARCPDCLTREFVTELRSIGVDFGSGAGLAVLTHWPGEAHAVEDDLLSLKRHGKF